MNAQGEQLADSLVYLDVPWILREMGVEKVCLVIFCVYEESISGFSSFFIGGGMLLITFLTERREVYIR